MRSFFANGVCCAVTVLCAGEIAAQVTGKGATEVLYPGAKLLHRTAYEVPRRPILLETSAGPQLMIKRGSAYEFDGKAFTKLTDIVLWDLAGGKEAHVVKKEGNEDLLDRIVYDTRNITSLALSPDGKKLAYFLDNQVKLYDFAAGKSQLLPTSYARSNMVLSPDILFAPDGALVVFHNGLCTIHEVGKAKPRITFKLLAGAKPADLTEIDCAAFSPNGSRLAVATRYGPVAIYDIKTGKATFQAPISASGKGNYGELTSLAFSPSAEEPKLLVLELGTPQGMRNVVARVFDLKTKKETSRLQLALKKALASYWVCAAHACFTAKSEPRVFFDGAVHDVATRKKLHDFDQAAGVTVSRDGKYVVRLTTNKTNTLMKGIEIWSVDGEK